MTAAKIHQEFRSAVKLCTDSNRIQKLESIGMKGKIKKQELSLN